MPRRSYDLEERLLAFAVQVARVAGRMPRTMIGQHSAIQLFRAATSPAANYAESQAAESRRDFVHKLRISMKELRETGFWLAFAHRMELGEPDKLLEAITECDELRAIMAACIRSATKGRP